MCSARFRARTEAIPGKRSAPDEYRRFRDALGKTDYVRSLAEVKVAEHGYEYDEALDEAVADEAGRMITDGKVLDEFIERNRSNRTLLEKVRDAIRTLWEKLTGADKRQAQTALGKLNAALDAGAKRAQEIERSGANKNAATEGGETPRFSKKSIQNLTENEVRTLLENSMNGEYAAGSYIPLRRNTPALLIKKVAEHSGGKVSVENLPVIMNVGKARQAMEESTEKKAGGARQHGLGVDGMIGVIYGMDDPAYIVLQTNGRYAEIVRYRGENGGRPVWIALDFGQDKYSSLLNGYDGGTYNVVVTAFTPDDFKKYLSSKVEDIVYDKAKDTSRSDSGRRRPSYSSEMPFADSITDENEKSKPKFSLKSDGKAARDAEAVGTEFDAETESVNPSRFSLKTWNESEYVQARDEAAAELAKAIGISVKKTKDYIDSVNSVARMIADDRVRLDYVDIGLSPFVSNVGYGVVKLTGLTLRERAEAMASLAHPDFREELLAYARENFR